MLQPRTAAQLFSSVSPITVKYSRNHDCGVSLKQEPGLYIAPPDYPALHNLGPVYRQFYEAQCHNVSYDDGRKPKEGKPHLVILCWAGEPVPGVSPDEREEPRPSLNSPIWVSCSCEFFLYTCEWALARYGSSDILYSNGKAARMRNPRGIPVVCKHIYLALKHGLRDYTPVPRQEPAQEPQAGQQEEQAQPQEPTQEPQEALQEEQTTPPEEADVGSPPPPPMTLDTLDKLEILSSYTTPRRDRYTSSSMFLRSLAFPTCPCDD